MQKEDISLLISVHWKDNNFKESYRKILLKKSYSWYLLKLIPESSHIRRRSFGKREREKRIISHPVPGVACLQKDWRRPCQPILGWGSLGRAQGTGLTQEASALPAPCHLCPFSPSTPPWGIGVMCPLSQRRCERCCLSAPQFLGSPLALSHYPVGPGEGDGRGCKWWEKEPRED